ncbi:homocysteine S-methyltransferase family protein [Methylobacterium sp. WSM2598]|uniref:homocysteine S-methyltransferase family protein n=1 Tax=Methylobacterium sp. WSM2598 TaxID=398261 RepID=UPI000476EDD5|nr:homocysteine S-methyltransferase family protein [Methylobacterium sp. WSM2598]
MPQFRNSLPQLTGRPFLTEGGVATTLKFREKIDLPDCARFLLLNSTEGRCALTRCVEPYLELARKNRTGLILDTPTWRANPDWGAKLGYNADALAEVNRAAVGFVDALRRQHAQPDLPFVLNGVIGPRGDGYTAEATMSADDAAAYHRPQIEVFQNSEADMVSADTLTFVDEAIGIAIAARDAKMPVAISFTLETDGRLPSGQTLGSAIEETDAATGAYPAYYMIGCTHPLHIEPALTRDASWLARIRGVRANASTKSHAELDGASDLDSGDPQDLGYRYATLRSRLPNLNVLGGCCGTDHRHIEAICEACL